MSSTLHRPRAERDTTRPAVSEEALSASAPNRRRAPGQPSTPGSAADRPLRVVVAAGGTGGHVFPAIAIADAIRGIAGGRARKIIQLSDAGPSASAIPRAASLEHPLPSTAPTTPHSMITAHAHASRIPIPPAPPGLRHFRRRRPPRGLRRSQRRVRARQAPRRRARPPVPPPREPPPASAARLGVPQGELRSRPLPRRNPALGPPGPCRRRSIRTRTTQTPPLQSPPPPYRRSSRS